MSGSQLLLAVSSAALLLASGAVGIRLLLLSRRTGGVPEWLMGVGLSLLVFVCLPPMLLSGIGRLAVGEVGVVLLAAASVLLWLSFSCFAAFTWQAFRCDAAWALVLTGVISSALAASCGGMVASILASPADVGSFEAAQLWTGLLRVPVISCFAWTSVEGLHNWRMARRREALGLGDPVVTNRFLLWGVVGLIQTAVNTLSAVLHANGVGIMSSPLGLFVVAVAGLLGAVFLTLTFMPPPAYLAFVRGRAAAPGS